MKLLKRWPVLFLFLAGCASIGVGQLNKLDQQFGVASPKQRMVEPGSASGAFYHDEVQPLLDKRCVVCHGCYDAPCQLKLSSPAGIDRGASKNKVYDGTRLLAATPTRLGVDAHSTFEWRQKDFFSVLNERTQTANTNLNASVFYQLLEQKQEHPLPQADLLDRSFELGLARNEQCTTLAEYDQYRQEKPLWGMPYALPGLKAEEHNVLKRWLESGAAMSNKAPLSQTYNDAIEKWEGFLNQKDYKHQLTARYIYEHLFLANIYFNEIEVDLEQRGPKEYFRLVRSSTPPSLPINVVNTRRPYDDPGVNQVYYRLQRVVSSQLLKTHMPYVLNDKKLERIQQLFIEPDYTVESLPSYKPEVAANPFIAFQALPVRARYRFMLEEAQFTIMGFIKGPVCRGQIALNVINDHFWVMFTNPEHHTDALSDLLAKQSGNLKLPGEKDSNATVLTNWIELSAAQKKYQKSLNALTEKLGDSGRLDMDVVWDGDNQNPNAALTIFRHFDSATVVKGFAGQEPKTIWRIGYPLLERIHYLLVAEFDVYGNIGHQLNTRLYMDFLRMEGEGNFLAMLPAKSRKKLWAHWYRDTHQDVSEYIFGPRVSYDHKTHVEYDEESSVSYKTQFLDKVRTKLGTLANSQFNLSNKGLTTFEKNIEDKLAKLNTVNGKPATVMPEIGLLSVRQGKKMLNYTILRNSAHSNINTLLFEEENRLPSEDYLTVTRGIAASYPEAFWVVNPATLNDFIKAVSSIETEEDYRTLMSVYGIRRTHPDFWQHSDQIHQQFEQDQPIEWGLLDYNRLENR